MRLDITTGKLIADNEDYRIERNTIHVNNYGDQTVFRCLTDDGQLFAAAVPKDADPSHQMAVGELVKFRAATAPPMTQPDRHVFGDRGRFTEVQP